MRPALGELGREVFELLDCLGRSNLHLLVLFSILIVFLFGLLLGVLFLRISCLICFLVFFIRLVLDHLRHLEAIVESAQILWILAVLVLVLLYPVSPLLNQIFHDGSAIKLVILVLDFAHLVVKKGVVNLLTKLALLSCLL